MDSKLKPAGYLYRYADGTLRLNGAPHNGSGPIESVPYYIGPQIQELRESLRVIAHDLRLETCQYESCDVHSCGILQDKAEKLEGWAKE
jgi:hypothetical protein